MNRPPATPRRAPPSVLPLVGLAALVAITAAWWALALWPLPADAPAWAARVRSVCFGTGETGLPDASGWIALLVQPGVMAGVFAAIWGRELATWGARMRASAAGRAALGAIVLALLLGVGLVVARIHGATAPPDAVAAVGSAPPRLEDRPAPALPLVDQHGRSFEWAGLDGRPAFVTFAFGHCETVCPLVVRNALRARDEAPDPRPVVVVVTLDPWRDTPSRLPSLSERWGLAAGDRALSGDVSVVEATLDRWEVGRSRNPRTGDLVHPAVTFVVGREGTVVWRTAGDAPTLRALARRLAADRHSEEPDR